MKNRVLVSSDHVDKHGDIMTKEALQSGADLINGERCVKWTVEHKRDIPPIGKIYNGEVIEKDGQHYLIAEQFEFDIYEELSWNKNYIKASCSRLDKPFNEPEFEIPEKLTIDLDPHIFKSWDDFENYQKVLKEYYPEINTSEYGRKALINDPEIVIKIAEYIFIYKLLKPIVDKTADKISDKLAAEAGRFYDLIRKSASELVQRVKPTKRALSYVIKVPGKPEIELFARTNSSEELIKALKPRKIEKVKDEMTLLLKKVDIEKVQFILEKGKWKFNYLLTEKGEVIGTKKSYKKRDRKLEYVKEMTRKKN